MRRFSLHWLFKGLNRPRVVSGVNVADACRRVGLNATDLETLVHWNEQHVENEPNCTCHDCYYRRPENQHKKVTTN